MPRVASAVDVAQCCQYLNGKIPSFMGWFVFWLQLATNFADKQARERPLGNNNMQSYQAGSWNHQGVKVLVMLYCSINMFDTRCAASHFKPQKKKAVPLVHTTMLHTDMTT